MQDIEKPAEKVLLDVNEIRYTHDSIACTFSDGTHLLDAVDKLRCGDMCWSEFPHIHVYWDGREGAYFSTDNRRLYVFKEACVDQIRARVITKIRGRRVSTCNGGRSVRVRQGLSLTRSANFPRDTSEGCWIFTHCEGGWTFWYADRDDEWSTGYSYPKDSKFVVDGIGGVWVLCSTTGETLWKLWHLTSSSETSFFVYPPASQLFSDGTGGVWILCETNGEQHWQLWHSTEEGERRCYSYPSQSTIVWDGKGGVWALAPTGKDSSQWTLWQANQQGEWNTGRKYPSDAKLVGDGSGGVWILCATDAEYGLWRVVCGGRYDERFYYTYPSNSQMVGDGRGGVWIICASSGSKIWKLWHASRDQERMCHSYPENTKMTAAGDGGVWLLCSTNGEWKLWYADHNEESELYEYPSASVLVTTESTA